MNLLYSTFYSRVTRDEDSSPCQRMMREEQQDIIGESLYRSLKAGGFTFLVDFKELEFNPDQDLIGGGGYGDVFVGKWLGVKVAIKKFGKNYNLNRKNKIKEFIKEIEVVHSLRHPNIILYMGVSFDQNQYYYMITEYVSRGSLFDIIHKQKVALDEEKVFKIAK